MAEVDPRVTKKRVTMKNYDVLPELKNGAPVVVEMAAVDYVREDFLDAYVESAKTRWKTVEVSEEYDAGPAGYDGQTVIPDSLDHPDAGVVYPANEG